ncbi:MULTISPECIES: PepSY-associated TM helix domain-containing protein [Pseudomonas]|uniref:PepSY domain-containing protein n=1 Tax=Pseudomonas quercus TaxID=2722792 RepID=A0ABX0YEC6_9PSED|nr:MULTISPECIES: PepSY domain-containing protein [Pseudomonas]MBF7142028.1 PepSY domain-containing protein [Pseudomonas sp. LY10J]NJP00566.1 PepSY domain-containing protein [Pseudomonas quercus]
MRTSFYNLAWRWHFYAGLLVAPVMILLAVTGIVYLFKPQLDPLMYPELLHVEAMGQRLPADTLLARVRETYPDAQVNQYLPPASATASAQFVVQAGGNALNLFMNPYTGQVLGTQHGLYNLQAIARALHGELMIGKVGDAVVELAAGWGIVLVVSGLYLWWPRGKGAAGVFWPRLRSRGRVFWRDLHAVVGFWGSVGLLFMLLTGMTWTGIWGKQYAELWNRFPTGMFSEIPLSDVSARTLNNAARQTLPWAMENTPMPMSGGDHAEHMGHGSANSGPAAPQASLQAVVETAERAGVHPGYSITLPKTGTGVYTVAVFADDPRNDATLHIDQYTGKVLVDVRYAQYGLLARATELSVMLHEGKMFGLANQLIVLVVCLMVLLGSISGLVIWWKRRPAKGLGVPPLRHGLPLWKTAVAVMVCIGVAFPLVGASLVAVAVLEYGVLRWVRRPKVAERLQK